MAESRILDPRTGLPFKMSYINSEPQTSRVASLHSEFSEHPTLGLTPSKIATILREAEQGDMLSQNDLFDDMEEKDAHIYAEMQKRKLALLGLEWDIVAPRNATAQEQKAADLAREIVRDMDNFEDVILDMASAIGHGYSCLEYDQWERNGKEWLPGDINFRPQRWFTVDQATRTELRLRNASTNGDPLQPFSWIVHRHQARSGYISRGGLHRVLAWPFLFKNYSVRDLAEFLEIYGLPMRLGKYPAGADDKEKATLLQAVVNIGHAAAGIIPEGMAIDFVEAAKGASDPFMAMIEWAERSQSKAILGGTLTSGTGDGTNTNALGNVHNEVRHDLLVADSRQIAGTLTRDLVYPIVALNGGGIINMRRCPRFVFDTSSSEELNTFSLGISRFVNLGMKIRTDWLHEKTKIPMAEDGDEILVPLQQQQQQQQAAALRASVAALRGETPREPGVVDKQLERLQDEGDAEEMIDAIQELLGEVASLEEFRDRLLEAVPDMSTEKVAEVIAQAMIAAEMAGRYDILNGN